MEDLAADTKLADSKTVSVDATCLRFYLHHTEHGDASRRLSMDLGPEIWSTWGSCKGAQEQCELHWRLIGMGTKWRHTCRRRCSLMESSTPCLASR